MKGDKLLAGMMRLKAGTTSSVPRFAEHRRHTTGSDGFSGIHGADERHKPFRARRPEQQAGGPRHPIPVTSSKTATA